MLAEEIVSVEAMPVRFNHVRTVSIFASHVGRSPLIHPRVVCAHVALSRVHRAGPGPVPPPAGGAIRGGDRGTGRRRVAIRARAS